MARVEARINIHSTGRRVSRQRHQSGDKGAPSAAAITFLTTTSPRVVFLFNAPRRGKIISRYRWPTKPLVPRQMNARGARVPVTLECVALLLLPPPPPPLLSLLSLSLSLSLPLLFLSLPPPLLLRDCCTSAITRAWVRRRCLCHSRQQHFRRARLARQR